MMRCILYSVLITILLLLLQYHHVAAAAVVSTTHNATNNTEMSRDMQQKLALFQFKLSFSIDNSPQLCDTEYDSDSIDNSPSWHPKTMNWSMDSDYCKWDGVTCNQRTGDVIGLDLSCSNLVGSINPNSTLFQLSHLQVIDFSDNYISGIIPEEIFHLPNLQELSISPGSRADSNNLKQVSASLNFPKIRWGSNNTLQMLSLNVTTIIGGVLPQEIFYLPSLMELRLDSTNLISIRVPKLKWDTSTTLHTLSLGGTFVGGVIPEGIFHLPKLEELSLSSNPGVSVNLPKLKWGSSNTLRKLDLMDIKIIGGVLPDSLGHLSSLTSLYLLDCNLSGPIPISITNLTQLSYLDLSDNHLSGQIPDSLANLKQLLWLDLGGNNLKGEFPSWVANLTQLSHLYLHDNSLTGSLPSYLPPLSLPQLYLLGLSNNSLSGTIPSWLFQLPSLTRLYIDSNKFTGQLPYQFNSSRSALKLFWCSNNSLNGTIPKSFSKLVNLIDIRFSSNNFSGVLDLDGCSPYLKNIDLHSNMLNGSLSSSICSSTSLEILNLSHNNFSGLHPVCPGNLNYSLSVLDLRMNNITGSLPSALSNFRNLRTLNLNSNKLQGTIPISFSEFDSLEVLDLGSNHIDGTFPHCLEALPKLQVLILKSNKFHGIITNNSKIEHSFPSLRILDLSENQFSGPLPAKYIKNFKGMMNGEVNKIERNYMGDSIALTFDSIALYSDSIALVIKGVQIKFEKILTVFTTIDLSRNIFEGEIPAHIGNLVSLRYLNLSHNYLTGSIPSTIGDLSVLESLDFSSNQLVGEIPQQLTQIDSLAKLNMSQNDLNGHIPEGAQFSTFDNNSYSGNPGLCGLPLSKKCMVDNIKPHEEEDDYFFNGFSWEAVVIGYGCGVVVGFVGGYIMFMAGKPKWYVGIIAKELGLKVKRIEIVRR